MGPKLNSKNWRYSTNLNSSKQFICNNSSSNSNSGNCYSNNSNIYKNSRYLISICSSTNSRINIRPSKSNFDNRSSICWNWNYLKKKKKKKKKKTKQNKTKQNKTKQNKTKQKKTKQ